MKLSAVLCLLVLTSVARADFASEVDLSPLQTLSLQDRQTIKTFDSYARQTVTAIAGRSSLRNTGDASIDGKGSLYTLFDLSFRPEVYRTLNIIRIRNAPLRKDFVEVSGMSDAEKDRIKQEGTLSLVTYENDDTQAFMAKLQSTANFKAEAVNELAGAAATMQMISSRGDIPPIAVFPPPPGSADRKWKTLDDIAGTAPTFVDAIKAHGQTPPPPIAGYDVATLDKSVQAYAKFANAWRDKNAKEVNIAVRELSELLPKLNAELYPSLLKRQVEVVYNRLAWMTLPGASLYFIAFVLFLLASRSGLGWMRLWGLRFFLIALIVHTIGIAVRWWLVQKNTEDWFHSIPIKNMFESVTMSAWFGALFGFVLELKRGRGIFGAAATFVGWLSLLAIFAAPFVRGQDIGGEIGQVNGVLMSYWLYIHVTAVTASYALIGMGFLLGCWYLVRYYTSVDPAASRGGGRDRDSFSRESSKSQVVARSTDDDLGMIDGGALSMTRTLSSVLFFTRSAQRGRHLSDAPSASPAPLKLLRARDDSFLQTLDTCNLVVIQLAFWLLGGGIILGAVWADMSWGRPWGWDPKETFALVTWIVYLIVVHVRIAVREKAWWTAVLSVVGFFVMLFNWIGVNFFKVGLHSYA